MVAILVGTLRVCSPELAGKLASRSPFPLQWCSRMLESASVSWAMVAWQCPRAFGLRSRGPRFRNLQLGKTIPTIRDETFGAICRWYCSKGVESVWQCCPKDDRIRRRGNRNINLKGLKGNAWGNVSFLEATQATTERI